MPKKPTKRDLINRWLDQDYASRLRTQLNAVFVDKVFRGPLDMRGITVGVREATPLTDTREFIRARLSEVDLAYGTFACQFVGGLFEEINFARATFDTCSMSSAHFCACSFPRARLSGPWFDDAVFTDCGFEGARLQGRRWREGGGRRVLFERCDFSGALFRNLELRACKFRNCIFEDAKFEICIISHPKFFGSAPKSAQFHDCDIAGTDFTVES